MAKMHIEEFDNKYDRDAYLVQQLYMNINVKALYDTLIADCIKQKREDLVDKLRNSYNYMNNNVKDLNSMSIGEILDYATEKCLSPIKDKSEYDQHMLDLGHFIIMEFLVELFKLQMDIDLV